MRCVIGALPPEQGQSLEDMIDHDRHTIETWCQRGGIGTPSHVAGVSSGGSTTQLSYLSKSKDTQVKVKIPQ
jgi:hypothetical protein